MKGTEFKPEQYISPAFMYTLKTLDNCKANTQRATHICNAEYNFKLGQQDSCHYQFICESLDMETYDGTHSIQLEVDDEGQRHVLGPNIMYDGILTIGQNFRVKVWYRSEPKVDLECHFWCSKPQNNEHQKRELYKSFENEK